MIGWLKDLFNWLFGLWEKLPDSVKQKLIDVIVESFDLILRAFYEKSKEDGQESGDNPNNKPVKDKEVTDNG